MTWVAKSFSALTDTGLIEVAGWVSEPFALDFRLWDVGDDTFDPILKRGWTLTHIPTGFQVAGILQPLEKSKAIAERFRALGDWDFDEPNVPAPLKPRARALIDELGEAVTKDAAVHSCMFTDWGNLAIEEQSS